MEDTAFVDLTLNLDDSPMPLDDPKGDRKTQTRSLTDLLGSKKGREQSVQVLRRDPTTVIFDHNLDAFFLRVTFERTFSGGNGYFTARFGRIQGIDHEIDQHPLKLAAIQNDRGQIIPGVEDKADTLHEGLVLQGRERGSHKLIEIGRLRIQFRLSGS